MNDMYQNLPQNTEQEEVVELNPIQRAISIFYEPSKVFKAIKHKPALLIPMLIIPILLVLLALPTVPAMQEYLMQTMIESIEAQGLSMTEVGGSLEWMLTLQGAMVIIVIPITVIITWLLVALFFWAGAKIFKGEGEYTQYLSMVTNIGWLDILYSFVVMILIGFIGIRYSEVPITSLTNLLPETMHQTFIGGFLRAFEVFAIWKSVLAIIGISEIGKISKGKASAIVVFGFVLGALTAGASVVLTSLMTPM